MSKIIFTESQRRELESNPNLIKVSDRSTSYSPDFKVTAVKENKEGKGPYQIFTEHGFDMSIIGPKKPKQCIKRWRQTFHKYGEVEPSQRFEWNGSKKNLPNSKSSIPERQWKRSARTWKIS